MDLNVIVLAVIAAVVFLFIGKIARKPKQRSQSRVRVQEVHTGGMRARRVQAQHIRQESYGMGHYFLFALAVYGLFLVYVVLSAGLYAGACSPSRETWQVFTIPILAGLAVLLVLTFTVGKKIITDNNALFEAQTPAILKLVVLVVVVGGIGYHVSLFGNC